MSSFNFKLPLNGGNSSKGEQHIENVLQQVTDELNTFYVKEVKLGYFQGKRRRADFCFNYKGKTFLIEFDGIQHSTPIDKFGGQAGLSEVKARDKWENLIYCPKNNICLIRYKVFSYQLQHNKDLLDFITVDRLKSDIKKAFHCKYVQNSISYGRKKLAIASDIDDVLVDWRKAHERKFNCVISEMDDHVVTEQVQTCKKDKEFWSNLPLLERPDFVPKYYCTKRINSKSYTISNFKKLGLPIRPIIQLTSQTANKARYLKNKCDVLIDDSWFNVKQCLSSGFPALLVTRPHNKHIKTKYRVNHLRYQEISKKYYELFR